MSRAVTIPADEAVDYLVQLLNLAEACRQALARLVDLKEDECPTCAGTGFESPRADEHVHLGGESIASLLRVAAELRELVTDDPAWLEETASGVLRPWLDVWSPKGGTRASRDALNEAGERAVREVRRPRKGAP